MHDGFSVFIHYFIMKPKVKLTGTDGNVFALTGLCTKALKKEGLESEAKEMADKIFDSESYAEALSIMSEYCDIS